MFSLILVVSVEVQFWLLCSVQFSLLCSVQFSLLSVEVQLKFSFRCYQLEVQFWLCSVLVVIS